MSPTSLPPSSPSSSSLFSSCSWTTLTATTLLSVLLSAYLLHQTVPHDHPLRLRLRLPGCRRPKPIQADSMERLPDELVLHMLSFLDPRHTAGFQATCTRFLRLGRDERLWKGICYDDSAAEAARRHAALLAAQEPRLAALRRALDEQFQQVFVQTQAAGGDTSAIPRPDGVPTVAAEDDGSADERPRHENTRARALANWDPSYASRHANFYEDYIHRHAPIGVDWLNERPRRRGSRHIGAAPADLEYTGFGILPSRTAGETAKIVAPLENGAVKLWDLSSNVARSSTGESSAGSASVLALSAPNLITSSINAHGSQRARPSPGTREAGAVENVSIDPVQNRAYVACHSILHELDLSTLQVIRRQPFPHPITCLSEARHPTPMTVGTLMSLHLYDVRVNSPNFGLRMDAGRGMGGGLGIGLRGGRAGLSSRCELIGGGSSSCASLSQPGPLSILHLPSSPSLLSGPSPSDEKNDIWVAGRFTSLLNFDRRYWPRIRGTVFSGARLSSLATLPYPYLGREADLMRNPSLSPYNLNIEKTTAAVHRTTLLAAGEYKGKGSLELYSLSRPCGSAIATGHEKSTRRVVHEYRNRQSASRSRLLSVAAHGTRIVTSDGDGVLKWVERDGTSVVRSYNVTEQLDSAPLASSPGHLQVPGEAEIVQRVLGVDRSAGRPGAVNESDLVVWTGSGRLGVLGFGSKNRGKRGSASVAQAHMHGDRMQGIQREGKEEEDVYSSDSGYVSRAVTPEEEDEMDEQEQAAEEYDRAMRHALERHADETRVMAGLGRAMGM